jgi:hypothetical protein
VGNAKLPHRLLATALKTVHLRGPKDNQQTAVMEMVKAMTTMEMMHRIHHQILLKTAKGLAYFLLVLS